MKRLIFLMAIAMTSMTVFAQGRRSAQVFKAGAAKGDITPEVTFPYNAPHEQHPYTGVHDSLFVRVVVMENGQKRAVLVELDETSVPEPERMQQTVADVAGVTPDDVIICVSHTHSTLHPGKDTPKMNEKIISSTEQVVRQAMERLTPARIAFGRTKAYANVNNGELAGSRRQYDDEAFSDKTLDIIRLSATDGKNIALILNYSTHAEVMFRSVTKDGGYEVSGDLPGRVAAILEGMDSGAPVVLTTTGAEGDQQPMFTAKQRTSSQGIIDQGEKGWAVMDVLARRIVDATLEKMAGMNDEQATTIETLTGNASVPGQNYHHNWQTGENHLQETANVNIPLRQFTIGQIAIQGVGADLASEIGVNIRNASPWSNTMLITNTVGSIGYVLSDKAYENPGHGVFGSKVKPGHAQDSIIKGFQTMNKKSYIVEKLTWGNQTGKIYTPAVKTDKAGIVLVTLHAEQNYQDFIANAELARHGYTVIGSGPVGDDDMESKILCVKNCVDYALGLPWTKKIVLLGHSGGATLMTAYQYLAENGTKATRKMLFHDYSDAMNHLAKADGVLLLDANWGMATVVLNSIDANVINEQTGELSRQPIAQSDEQAYMKAQQQRYMRIVNQALKTDGSVRMSIPGAESVRFYNKLYSFDLNLINHTQKPWPLIHKDGSVTTEIVHSVRAPLRMDDRLSPAITPSVKGFLSVKAIRVGDDYEVLPDGMKGIDWTSNLTTPIGNAAGITVPLLAIGMTGSWEYLAAESIYRLSASNDKQIAFVEGAGHMLQADQQAEQYNNTTYGNTLKNCIDYADRWLSAEGRFINR